MRTVSGMGGYAIPVTGSFVEGKANYYDWGPANQINDQFRVNIVVELTFNYNGNEKTIISSRNYIPHINEDSSLSDIPNVSGNHIISDIRF